MPEKKQARRRVASPKASEKAPVQQKEAHAVPATSAAAKQPVATPQDQPKQPGLLAQAAATAGGVAVGSAVGHTVGHAITNAFSGGGSKGGEKSKPAVCEIEWKQLVDCVQRSDNISECQSLHEFFKKCMLANK